MTVPIAAKAWKEPGCGWVLQVPMGFLGAKPLRRVAVNQAAGTRPARWATIF